MSELQKVNMLTKAKLDSLDLTQYPNQMFGTTDEETEGGGSGASGVVDIEKDIITGTLLANYTVTTVSVYETLPLVKYDGIGTKLSINTSGGVVIGSGVNKIKVSGEVRILYNNLNANTIGAIHKNNTLLNLASIDNNGTTINNFTLSICPIIVSVSEGDIITLKYLTGNTSVHSRGIAKPTTLTYLTVEVVE